MTQKVPDSFWQIRDYVRHDVPKGSIISERELARKFGLSRYVTKTVLSTLEGEGILRCLPQRGYEVIDYSETDDATMLKVRCVLETDAVRRAADRATADDIRQLDLIIGDLNKAYAANDVRTYSALDYEFHRALVVAAHDPVFLKIFDVILGIHYLEGQDIPGILDLTHADHEAILQAIKEKSKEKAELAMYRHIGLSLRESMETLAQLSDELDDRMKKMNDLIMQQNETANLMQKYRTRRQSSKGRQTPGEMPAGR